MRQDEVVRRVTDAVDAERDALVRLCVELGNVPSPHAQEREAARAVVEWLNAAGIEARLQTITARSGNAVGFLPGTGDGPSLILDAHLDTGPELPPDAPERIRRIHGAWVEDGRIYGFGVANCKGQVAAFMIAARALLRAGVRLHGDLTVAGVAFETGEPSVDDTQGIDYPGVGFGSRWLIDRGVTADFALIGETSDFAIVAAECGQVSLRIHLPGRDVYTPRLKRGDGAKDHPSSIVRASGVLDAVEDWAVEYERRERTDFDGGTFAPRAMVQRVRGTPAGTDIDLDVYLVPGKNPQSVAREVGGMLRGMDVGARIEPYHWSRGYVARGAEPLVAALRKAHGHVLGGQPGQPPPEVVSMWRDLNAFNEVGIPSVCYGAPRQPEPYSDAGDRCMRIDDLVAATKVYALTAATVCGVV